MLLNLWRETETINQLAKRLVFDVLDIYPWLSCALVYETTDKAIATNNQDNIRKVNTFLLESAENPSEYPLWYFFKIPNSIKLQYVQAQKKPLTIDNLLETLAHTDYDEQEMLVKKIIKFWDSKEQIQEAEILSWAGIVRDRIPYGQTQPARVPVAPIPDFRQSIGRDTITREEQELVSYLINSQNVRFIGAQGSGKTSKAFWLCREHIKAGHQVLWFNPHAKFEDIEIIEGMGCQLVGKGRNYGEINNAIKTALKEMHDRYSKFATVRNYKPAPLTIVLDELTNYKDKCEDITEFVKASVQEFSKIGFYTIYVTHNDTLACMGAPEGIKELLQITLLDLYLERDPTKKERVPKPFGKLRLPGERSRTEVKIPLWMQ